MDMGLGDKVAVVTGASRGIGLAVATALAHEGARVVAASREPGAAVAELADRFPVLPVAVDLAAPDGGDRLVAETVARFGGVDILVNNVGALDPRRGGGFLAVDDADWREVLDTNLLSMVRASRAALPVMLDRGGGVIVNISSLNARVPNPLVVAYGAAKAAMTNLSKALSEEFGPRGIRVATVSPGPVRTAMWEAAGGMTDTLAQATGLDRATVEAQLPQLAGITLGRVATADDIAPLVVFLVSGRAAMVTGADYTIDGGMGKSA